MALSKNTIKFLRALQLKKFRTLHRQFVVEGEKMALEMFVQRRYPVLTIYALTEWIDENEGYFLELLDTEVVAVTPKELERISGLKTPNQVLLQCQMADEEVTFVPNGATKMLYFDQIQNPGNVGTMIRTADWFGFHHIFFAPGTVDRYHPKVVQATMGAFSRVNLWALSLGDFVERYPEVAIFGAFLTGDSIFDTTFPETGLIVIGNESNGIAAENIPLIKHQVCIPAAQNSKMESLNAAVASGILMAWFSKSSY